MRTTHCSLVDSTASSFIKLHRQISTHQSMDCQDCRPDDQQQQPADQHRTACCEKTSSSTDEQAVALNSAPSFHQRFYADGGFVGNAEYVDQQQRHFQHPHHYTGNHFISDLLAMNPNHHSPSALQLLGAGMRFRELINSINFVGLGQRRLHTSSAAR